MHHFCTLFDINYLPRFLTMYHSLVRTKSSFTIYAFCMDDVCFQRMCNLKLAAVQPIALQQLEGFDAELLAVKTTRSLVEYYFTCTPAICNYILKVYPNIDSVTYLDSDLYFFSSPDVVFEEIGMRSIAIVEHRFSRFGHHFIKNGRFNVAWVTFRNDSSGAACLSEYREQCIDWCFDYLDGDKYGDQKYLDRWPDKYPDLHIIEHLGVNLAPWNLSNYRITLNEGKLHVDGQELVFFHFANLKQLAAGVFTTSVSSYFAFLPKIVRNKVYIPYLAELRSHTESHNLTSKTLNPKYQKLSIFKVFKEFVRYVRLVFFRDIIVIN